MVILAECRPDYEYVRDFGKKIFLGKAHKVGVQLTFAQICSYFTYFRKTKSMSKNAKVNHIYIEDVTESHPKKDRKRI